MSNSQNRPKLSVNQAKYKMWWDGKNQIGRIVFFASLDERATKELVGKVIKIMEEKGKTSWLVDVTRSLKIIPSSVSKIAVNALKHPNLEKIAFTGGNTFMIVAANLMMKASNFYKTEFFTTEEEALKWLKEK